MCFSVGGIINHVEYCGEHEKYDGKLTISPGEIQNNYDLAKNSLHRMTKSKAQLEQKGNTT